MAPLSVPAVHLPARRHRRDRPDVPAGGVARSARGWGARTACWSACRCWRRSTRCGTCGSSTSRPAACRAAARRSTTCSRFFLLTHVIRKVLSGSGECAKVTSTFLGLSMPAWVACATLALGVLNVRSNPLQPRSWRSTSG
ncbi:MAG: disulfide bond formation protein B [Steroidobacteraceae bacterium]